MSKEVDAFSSITNRVSDLEKKSVEWIVKDQFNVVINDIKNLTVMINTNTENLSDLDIAF